MHKTLIFDLGKVLVHFDFSLGYVAFEKFGPHSAAELKALVRAHAVDMIRDFETGLIEPADFHSRMCRILQLDADYAEFCDSWSSIFTEQLLPEEMLESLSSRYRMLVLSNTNAIHFDLVRRKFPVLRHFHHLVLSHEVKSMKPDSAIYQAALAAADCAPGECFYTDDIEENIVAGARFGLDAVRFDSRAQIEAAMRERGIVW